MVVPGWAAHAHDDIALRLQIGQGDFRRPADLDKVKVHFTMHAMLKSTLLLSTVVSSLSDAAVAVLTDPEALAIHQVQ